MQPIAFNFDRKESQTIFLNQDEIYEVFNNLNIEFIKLNKNTIVTNYQKNANKISLEYFFIVIAIILLIIELFLLKIWKI